MVSFIKQQLLIVSSVVNFMLSFKIRYNIKFLRAKCSSYWVQKMSLCRFFNFFFFIFQGSTKPPAYAIEIEVLHGNSDFSPAQYKQMLKESLVSIFLSAFVVWNRYHPLYLAQPYFQNVSVFLLPSHQDRLGEDSAVSVQPKFLHPEGCGHSLAVLLGRPGKIFNFPGLWSARKTA